MPGSEEQLALPHFRRTHKPPVRKQPTEAAHAVADVLDAPPELLHGGQGAVAAATGWVLAGGCAQLEPEGSRVYVGVSRPHASVLDGRSPARLATGAARW